MSIATLMQDLTDLEKNLNYLESLEDNYTKILGE